MKKIIATLGAVGIISLGAQAQVLIGSGTYSQDFNTLASSGSSASWTDNSTLLGWYASKALTVSSGTYGPFAYTSYRVDSGGNNSGNLFDYGSAASTDRALGSIASGTVAGTAGGPLANAIGLRIQNNTGSTWTGDIGISYTGEQWRQGGNTSSQVILSFSYATSATAFASPLSATTADAAYTAVPGLSFTSPNPGTATAAAIDGNAAGNYTAISGTLSGITLNAGGEIMLRWCDINDVGNDHGGGIDDFSVTFTPQVPEPSCLALTGLGMLTLALWRRRN